MYALLCLILVPNITFANRSDWDREANDLLRRESQRYEAYFEHQDQLSRRERMRKKAALGMEAIRLRSQQRRAAARKAQIEARTKVKGERWTRPEVYQKYLENVERLENDYLTESRKQADRRKYLEQRLKSSGKRLTDAQKYGLEY